MVFALRKLHFKIDQPLLKTALTEKLICSRLAEKGSVRFLCVQKRGGIMKFFWCCLLWMSTAQADFDSAFYSNLGREHLVEYSAVFRVPAKRFNQLKNFNETAQKTFIESEIKPTMAYIFGPLTNRKIGAPQKGGSIQVEWSALSVNGNWVDVPYTYQGKWMIYKEFSKRGQFSIDVPFNHRTLLTKNWKSCTDSMPKHQLTSLFWYFWDPRRNSCEHELGLHYQTVKVLVGEMTPMKSLTYPEYDRLIRVNESGQESMTMTFAFGYYETPKRPDPETDLDIGAVEYRDFRGQLRSLIDSYNVREYPILLGEYARNQSLSRIGTRFEFVKDNVRLKISLVVSSNIDQLDLFAKSFARDHDSYFGWFGHSRIGQGFDVKALRKIFAKTPNYFSVTPDYQIVHWAGCVSYAYFTLPFFNLKAQANKERDPEGTKGLDIIANGLKGYFIENSETAYYVAKALIFWEKRTSYQKLIDQIENPWFFNNRSRVMASVLGDEDNP